MKKVNPKQYHVCYRDWNDFATIRVRKMQGCDSYDIPFNVHTCIMKKRWILEKEIIIISLMMAIPIIAAVLHVGLLL